MMKSIMLLTRDIPFTAEAQQVPNVSLERAGHLIDQVAEQFPGGKLACSLATQLNANVALGFLDSVSAAEMQDELCHNPDYDRLWSCDCDSRLNPQGRAWMPVPWLTHEVILENMGVQLASDIYPIRPFSTMSRLERLTSAIRHGSVAYVAGKSAVASHARLIFSPAELQHKIYVHDPNYIETTGLYDYADLIDFCRVGTPWVYDPPTPLER